ncbi:Uncharacterised protein [Salmonella enterica subsp. enterica serovar Typhi]|nr:Uncharacterised protein [Salmonella enterica subsp. enterica serovar Typhi]
MTGGRRLLLLFGLAPVIFCGWDQYVENTLFRQLFRTIAVFLDSLYANHFHSGIGQIADDRVHFFPDIAHFGEFGGFDFNERRVGEFCQTTGDFGFTDAGRANHQNIFRRYFVAQLFIKLHTTPAVTQCNRHGTLCVILADNVFVQFADNFAWGHFRHERSLRFGGQFFNGVEMVGVNADIACNIQRLFSNFARAELGIFQQSASGSLGIRTAGADSN